MRTGLLLEIIGLKLDFSRTKNIPEADADGRPVDFVGAYILDSTIAFPQSWNHDSTNSTALIKGRNLLIGTGGISGIISLETSTGGTALFRLGDPNNTGKHFQLSLDQFLLEFKQNAIVQSEIRGYMRIPGFKDGSGNDADINVLVHIGNNGDFRITASEADGFQTIGIPAVFQLALRSVSIGRENDKWYIEASGSLFLPLLVFLEPHLWLPHTGTPQQVLSPAADFIVNLRL